MSDEELGVEEVNEAAEVEVPVADEAPAPTDVPAPPADVPPAPATPPVAVTDMPPRKPTGLIVVVGAIVILLVVALFAWQPMMEVVNKWMSGTSATGTGTVTPAKAKITATIAFIEAILDGNTMAIKPLLTDEAQAAATPAQWTTMASEDTTGNVTFAAPVWSGDTTAVVSYTAPDMLGGADTTGTLTFSFDPANPLQVAMLADTAGTQDTITITVAAAGSAWRIVSLTSGTQTQMYDAAFIKSIAPTETAQ